MSQRILIHLRDAGATAQSYAVTTQHLQSSRDINEAIHAHIVSPYKGSRLDHEFSASPGATDAQVRGDVTELVQVRIERSIVVENEDGSRVYPMGRDSAAKALFSASMSTNYRTKTSCYLLQGPAAQQYLNDLGVGVANLPILNSVIPFRDYQEARSLPDTFPLCFLTADAVSVSRMLNFSDIRMKCNYACEFCFHTAKNLSILPLEDAKRGLRLLAEAGMKKLNISGGEPFLKPTFIGELFRFCKEELHIESCSVVNNGSKVTERWLDEYGRYLDVMAISCDSFETETNVRLGRTEQGSAARQHTARVFEVSDWCRARGIKVKINSVITKLNWEEDMNGPITELSPFRWKSSNHRPTPQVFQVLLLDSENTGEGSLRDARHLTISAAQFDAFLARHKGQPTLVPEDNETMKDSYLSLDEEMRFLNCREGGKIPGRSILQVGVREALKDTGFNRQKFLERGGVFDWTRSEDDLDW
ncbi:hypothetical protein EW146_g8035 [Bondarzewia mesenterica]|uniref:Radical SAM core domain-containing protein n=1 Tax=Bondarzewia mesenterica TaxID=1095465 RepID=A0A4S4LHH6_9AGAM|nr:hypothetical protein EW146_g8035 [Bondarzewia mesenterica]